jgi:hypothetical protein
MTAENRISLRRAQAYWHHPKTVAMFARWGLKPDVLRWYKRFRRQAHDPECALGLALHEWDL